MAGNNKMSPRKAMAMGKAAKKAGVKKRGMGGGVAKKAGVKKGGEEPVGGRSCWAWVHPFFI